MAQRKIDRFEQMSKQEELIAKKRREILEKQRTAELAKKVAQAMKESKTKDVSNGESEETVKEEEKIQEAQECEKVEKDKDKDKEGSSSVGRNSLTSRTGKIIFGQKRSISTALTPNTVDQPPPKVQNNFCNDGSFLDHFKKILEKQEKPKILPTIEVPAPPQESEALGESEPIENDEINNMPPVMQPHSPQTTMPPVSVAVSMPTPQPFAFTPNFLAQGMLLQPPQQSHTPEQPQPLTAAFFAGPFANFAPPPPPPPQLPMSLANLAPLYMIPAPEPLLSTIQAPKEFDLNAIPKPQLNLEAIQVPTAGDQFSIMTNVTTGSTEQSQDERNQQHQQQHHHHQHQHQLQQLQHHQDDNDHNCIQLPTTIENLIDLVADNGDEYEDKIRTQKKRLHPAMWFLFDKHCQQYQQYQHDLRAELMRRSQTQPQLQSQKNECISQDQNAVRQAEPFESNDKYDPETAFGAGDADSDDEYMRNIHDRNRKNLERRIEILNEMSESDNNIDFDVSQDGDTSECSEKRRKQRKSRWGEKVHDEPNASTSTSTAASNPPTIMSSFGNQNKPLLSTITRTDPGLLQYARQNYNSVNLTEEDWKKCEEHYKVNLLYQDMIRKRQEIDRLARSGKFKYEYDSDEDVDGGTWEHKLRTAEMVATQAWASALTKQSEGKHHIGDFLPPEELKKFMEQYEAKKNNRQPDLSDYKEYKLKEDNIGFQMLQKLGWKEGQGLGSGGSGIVDPVNKGPQRDGNMGLGIQTAHVPEECDNEYDAYRKRMMLAYRFRPNPLNNPRRAYY